MESLINEFMHLYFWVFIGLKSINFGYNLYAIKDIDEPKIKPSHVGFMDMLQFVVFIMSFKY